MNMNKLISLMLALVLALVLALSLVACGGQTASSAPASSAAESEAVSESTAEEPVEEPAEDTSEEYVENYVSFTFNVVDAEGNSSEFLLGTEKGASLGDALFQAGLIEPEEYEAGFVTIVNGIEANWDADQAWWNLQDAEGNSTPVGIADIHPEEGDVYSFVYTVGA